MSKKTVKELQQMIADLHEEHDFSTSGRDEWHDAVLIEAIRGKIKVARNLLNGLTSKIVATVGLVNWWYSTETGDSTVTYKGGTFKFQSGVNGVAEQFGHCVHDALQVKGVIE